MSDQRIRYDLQASVSGQQEVAALAAQIDALANTLDGDAKVQAVALGNALRDLGNKRGAIDAFVALKREAGDAADRLKETQQAAQALGREIAATGAPTRAQAGQMEKLRDAVRAAKTELQAKTKALDTSRATLREYGISSENVAASERATRQALAAARAEAEKLAQAYTAAGKTARDSGPEQVTAAQRSQRAIDGLADSATKIGRALAAGFTARELVQAAAQMESLQAGLQSVSGSADAAARDMEFVTQIAQRAGVDVTSAGKAFLGLAAATKGTAVEGEPARRVFESVSVAMARAGKTSADTERALLALSQMASKGTVSMEELRGQLGESLPGALQAAANGLGITTQDLIKLVETGQMAAADIFPALAAGLDELYAGAPKAQTLAQELTNVKNVFIQTADALGKAGGLSAVKVGAELAQAAIALLGEGVIALGKKAGTVAAAVKSWDFSGVSAAFAEIEAESQSRIVAVARNNETLRASLMAIGSEAIKTRLATEANTEAQTQAAKAAADAAPSYAALGAAYAKNREASQEFVTLASKEVEAVKARGDAAIAQAKALGDDEALRKALAAAAKTEAEALAELALMRQKDAEILGAELAAKEAVLAQAPKVEESRKKEIEALKQLIRERQIDADKAAAQAAAAQERAKMMTEEVQAAKAAADQTATLAAARRIDTQATISALGAQKELARQAAETAAAYGNEDLARAMRAEGLRIEIELVKARATAARVEAEGSILVTEAKIAEMEASGQLTAAKRVELEASIRLAQAKIKEADAMFQATGAMERQLTSLLNGEEASTKAATAAGRLGRAQRELAGDLDASATAQERANAATERAAELAAAAERKRLNVDAEGFSLDKTGSRLTAGTEIGTLTGIRNFLKQAGLTDAQALTVGRQFTDARGDVPYFDNPGQKAYGGDTLSDALLKAAERVLYNTALTGADAAAPASRTVVVELRTSAGTTERITTDEAGQAALIRALQRSNLAAFA